MKLALLFLLSGVSAFAQCGRLVVNPATGQLDCAGTGGVSASGTLTLSCILAGNGNSSLTCPNVNATIDTSGNITTPGTITTGNAGGVTGRECLSGATSGLGCITVAAVAGTPNDIVLPTATAPGAGAVMTSNAANPQQLSWHALNASTGTYGAGDASSIPQVSIDASGLITGANNISTVGHLKFIETGGVSNAAGTAAVSTTALCTSANCVAGFYEVEAFIASTVTCATPGPAIAGITIGWTDDSSAKTLKLPLAGVGLSGSDLTLGNTTAYGYARLGIRSTGAANITYAINYTACTSGTGTYATSISSTRIQ